MSKFFPLFLLISLVSTAKAAPVLQQVHVVTRHGSRFPLPKDPSTLVAESRSAGQLTPTGRRQMYDLGIWLRDQYRRKLLGNHIQDAVQMKHAYDTALDVYIESSATQRTLLSAQALGQGFVSTHEAIPSENVMVPVFSVQSFNDVWVQAYDKCLPFLQQIQDLPRDARYQKLDSLYQVSLLKDLAKLPEFRIYVEKTTGTIPLRAVWTLFDEVHVARTECFGADGVGVNNSKICDQLNDGPIQRAMALTPDQWNKLQQLVHDVENLKYVSLEPLTGRQLGQNLLSKMYQRMMTRQEEQATMFIYSAHFPTLLALFAALGVNPLAEADLIPSYGAALLVEYYQDDATKEGTIHVQFRQQEQVDLATGGSAEKSPPFGSLQTVTRLYPVDPELCPDQWKQGQGCPVSILQPSFWTDAEWCLLCDNHEADLCLRANVSAERSEQLFNSSIYAAAEEICREKDQHRVDSEPVPHHGGLFLFGGFVIGASIGIISLVVALWHFRGLWILPIDQPEHMRRTTGVPDGKRQRQEEEAAAEHREFSSRWEREREALAPSNDIRLDDVPII